jgi:D-alanine-D-alanine ligase
MSIASIKKRFSGKKIAVLMGGRSGEREVSLRSGKNVLAALKRQKMNAIGIDTGPDIAQKLTAGKVDVAFIILHGKYGEDGTIQGLLELMDIPYTGSGVLASALAMHKGYSKKIFKEAGISTPDFNLVGKEDNPVNAACQAFEELGFPLVVKPLEEGSSIGVSIVKSQNETKTAFKKLHRKYGGLIAERFIPGMHITTGILGNGHKARALPILELVPKGEFYDFRSKYTKGMTEFIIPARLPGIIYSKAQEMSLAAHHVLGCNGWSRVDAIVDRAGTPYILEVNTLPGMTDISDLPAEAKVEGMSYDDVVLNILDSARIS